MALKIGNPFIDALGGKSWTKAPDATGTRVFKYFLDNDTTAGHSTGGAWTPQEQSQFFWAVSTWSNVANIRFEQVNDASAADLIERKQTSVELTDKTIGTLTGRHESPDSLTAADKSLSGAFNTQTDWNDGSLRMGGARFGTIVHEIGHALGLAHPHDDGMGTRLFPGIETGPGTNPSDDTGDNGLNARINTVMSYAGRAGTIDFGHVATPMAFDIAAIQLMYGAVHNATGDNTYFLRDTEAAGTFYSCIWDTKGIDTIRYDGSGNATIDLRAAWLGNNDGIANDEGAGGFLSSVEVRQADGSMKRIDGGYTIAADITGFIPDQNGDWGVIIENATGGSGNDTLYGNGVANTLTGGAGNDHLNGFGGNDTMLGGMGDDQYVVYEAGDRVIDTFGTTGGHDTIYMYWHSWDMRVGNKGSWVEDLEYLGNGVFVGDGNALGNRMTGGANGDIIRGNGGDDVLIGAGGNDTLDGGAGNDQLYGGIGNDRLIGGANNDLLDGNEGSDTMTGGAGNDHYRVTDAGDKVVELAGAAGGVDTVFTTLGTFSLGDAANVENLVYYGTGLFFGFGNALANTIQGGDGGDMLGGAAGNDTLVGSGGNDSLDGGTHNDTLDGGVGDDTLTGGSGRDTLLGDVGNDVLRVDNTDLRIDGGAGYDYVYGDSTTVASGFKFAVGGKNVEQVYGNAGNDVIDATGTTDTVHATQFYGNAGSDLFKAGAGMEWFVGGQGSDTVAFAGNSANYTITAEEAGTGFAGWTYVYDTTTGVGDWLSSVEKFQFADGIITSTSIRTELNGTVGVDTITGGAGNEEIYGSFGKDILDGGDGNDIISGGFGADEIKGGKGGDVLYIDEIDAVIDGGEGYDQVYADESQGPVSGLTLDLAATNIEAAYGGRGNDTFDASRVTASPTNSVYLMGGAGNDRLIGSSGADWLDGESGNDQLEGGVGADYLTGGLDRDTFVFRGSGWGGDSIMDFNAAEGDRIDMQDVTGLDSFSQLSITEEAGSAYVHFGADLIHLSGIAASQVQSDWFIL